MFNCCCKFVFLEFILELVFIFLFLIFVGLLVVVDEGKFFVMVIWEVCNGFGISGEVVGVDISCFK